MKNPSQPHLRISESFSTSLICSNLSIARKPSTASLWGSSWVQNSGRYWTRTRQVLITILIINQYSIKKQALPEKRMLVIRIFFISPVGFEPVTKWLQVQFLLGIRFLWKIKGGKVGPAGIEPATWRITANNLSGYIVLFDLYYEWSLRPWVIWRIHFKSMTVFNQHKKLAQIGIVHQSLTGRQ